MRWGAALRGNVICHNHISTYHVDCKHVPFLVVKSYFTTFSSSRDQKQDSQQLDAYFQRIEGRKPLPLPPALNPSIVAARKRYRQPKPESIGHDRTEFQQKLYRNPYAWALASRPRSCRGTAIRIPTYFTVTFQPGIDPETKALVYLPMRNVQKIGLNVRLLATYDNVTVATTQPDYITARLTRYWLNKKRKPQWMTNMSEQTTAVLRHAVIRSLKWALKNPKSGLVEECKGALNITAKRLNKEAIEWERDRVHARSAGPAAFLYLVSPMGLAGKLFDQLNDIKRELQEISHEIGKLGRKLKGIGAPKQILYNNFTIPRSLPLNELRERFPVAWYHEPGFEGWEDDKSKQQSQTDSLSNAEPNNRPVPVYDLPFLLGEEGLEQLLKDTDFKDSHCLVLKDVRLNLECQMHLYKLQGYLSISEQYR